MVLARRSQLALAALVLVLLGLGALTLLRRESAAPVQPTPAAPAPGPSSPAATLQSAAPDPVDAQQATRVAIAAAEAEQQSAAVPVPVSVAATSLPASFVVTGLVRMTPAASQLAHNRLLEAHVIAITKYGHRLRAAHQPLVALDGRFEVDANDIAANLFLPENPIESVRVAVHAGAGALAEQLVERARVPCGESGADRRACRLAVELELEERGGSCFLTGRVLDEQGNGVPDATVGLLRSGAPPEFLIETASAANGSFLLRGAADGRAHLLLIAAEGFALSTQDLGAIAAEGMHLGERVLARGHCLTGIVRMGELEQVEMPVRISLSPHPWPSGAEPYGGFQRLRPWWTPNGFLWSGWYGETKADRSFEFCGLLPGTYRLHLSGLQRLTRIGNESVQADVVVPGGPIVLDYGIPTLIVRVDYDEGAPRGSAQLQMSCGERTIRSSTNQDGIAYLSGPAGAACTIEASQDGYASARANFAMPATGAVTELNFTLKKLQGGASLKLRIEDAQGALIEGDFGIALHPDPGIEYARNLDIGGRQRGGAVLIRELRAGRWSLVVRGGRETSSFYGRAQCTAELVEGETTELTLRLPLEGRWRLRVRDEQGQALACTVRLERLESKSAQREQVPVAFQLLDVDTHIFYSSKPAPYHAAIRAIPPPFWDDFETLAPGLYAVRVEAEGHHALTREFEVRAGERIDVDVELAPE